MIHLLNLFILANILLVVATPMAAVVFYFSKTPFREQLKFNYLLLTLVAATVIGAGFIKNVPTIKIIKSVHSVQLEMNMSPVPSALRISSKVASPIKTGTPAVLVCLVLLATAYVARELIKLFYVFRGTHSYKRIGAVRIWFAPNVSSPFSFWLPFRRYIVLPYSMAASLHRIRLCAAHEIQHHRQGDTKLVYVLVMTRILFFMNPAIYVWSRIINEVQEFSCDEVVLGRQNIVQEDYISCLIEVAENSLRQNSKLECATSLAFFKRQNLKRRIEFMLEVKKKNHGWLPALVTVSAVILSATALAGKNMIQERVIKPEAIKQIAGDKFFVDNDKALADLTTIVNDIANDPVKRKFIRDGMERYYQLKPDIDKMAADLGASESVLALGLIESGFQNFPPQNGDIQRSAGMWQIIQKTAKRLGLRVDSSVDERRDTMRSTNAALRYLVMNRALFDSWDLSVLAYNSGEKAVEEAIRKTGSRDPWVVKKALNPESQRYYVKWLAALLILQNPELVQE